jgi:hypothetical protein
VNLYGKVPGIFHNPGERVPERRYKAKNVSNLNARAESIFSKRNFPRVIDRKS